MTGQEFEKVIKETALKLVQKEVSDLCQLKNSSFKFDVDHPTEVSFAKQNDELKEKTPFVHQIINTIGINPKSKRYKKKSMESYIPELMTAVTSLIFSRNRLMNANAVINGCILRRGQAKK